MILDYNCAVILDQLVALRKAQAPATTAAWVAGAASLTSTTGSRATVLVLNHSASVASEATAAFSQLPGEKLSSSAHVSRSLYMATAMSPGLRVLMVFLRCQPYE